MKISFGKSLEYENLLQEAICLGRVDKYRQAIILLDRARRLVTSNLAPIKPEDDPARTLEDREAWRLARGA